MKLTAKHGGTTEYKNRVKKSRIKKSKAKATITKQRKIKKCKG